MQDRQERQRSMWVTTSFDAGFSFSSMSFIR
jgi:hypothetical protein